ncbi:MAG: cyclohexanecarboxylate-CoA ligase, partial [Pseudonocardiales bacterium]|nr:cyclohexanecarboxylate-CoA ligase [Pseudonocardiales bacterium]
MNAQDDAGWTPASAAPTADLWALIEWRSSRTPDATFLSTADGRSLTFQAYRNACRRAAAGLAAGGVGPGSVVAWQLPTELDATVLIGAGTWLRTVQVPLLTSYRQRELAGVVRQTRPDVLVVPRTWRGNDHAALASQAQLVEPAMGVVVVDGKLPDADPAGRDRPPPPSTDGPHTQWGFYTSG